MNIDEKSIFKKTALTLAIASILTFVVYHTMTYTVGGTVAAFVFFYFHEIIDFTLPLLAALSIYATYRVKGAGSALLKAIPYSLCFLLYLFPYYAFYYAYEGIEIGGVILFASLNALFTAIVTYIEIVVLYLLISLVVGKAAKRSGKGGGMKAPVTARPFDLDDPINCGILSASVAMLIYKLVYEIIDTVNYIIDYSGTYLLSEVIYMIFRYLFLLALTLGAHFILALIKNRAIKASE